MPGGLEAGVYHFRHGSIILILQKIVDLVASYEDQAVSLHFLRLRTEGEAVAAAQTQVVWQGDLRSLQLLELPIALVTTLALKFVQRANVLS
jgi:hypothetical protein